MLALQTSLEKNRLDEGSCHSSSDMIKESNFSAYIMRIFV